MRIVALEEHFSLPMIHGQTGGAGPKLTVADDENMPAVVRNVAAKIVDVGESRIADMDRNGISVQVLSKAGNHIGPSADLFDGNEAVSFARKFNDEFARKVAERPDRFAAFAHLPVSIPEAAADELERTVRDFGFKGTLISGTIRGAFLDDPKFAPLLARAEQLGVPIYVHPGMPPADVRKAYYEGFAPEDQFRARDIRLGLALRGGAARHAPRTGGHHGQVSAAELDHRPHGGGAAGYAGALRAPVFDRRVLSSTAAVQDDHRSGLRHVGRIFHQPAVRGGAGDVWN